MYRAARIGAGAAGALALYKSQSAPSPKCLAEKRDGVLAFGSAPAGAVGGPFGAWLPPTHESSAICPLMSRVIFY